MMATTNTNTQDHEQNQQQDSSFDTKKRPSSSSDEQQKVVVKCPRCDSSNTKFCYYNNYSLTQPRHFCKTCRRYWTNGGSLRNVPIGGGCRKKQKLKHSSSSSSSQSISKYSSSSALDFHLGGLLSLPLPLPSPFSSKLHHHANQPSFYNNQPSSFNLDHSLSSNSLMGLNNLYPFGVSGNEIQGMNNFMNVSNNNTSGDAITTHSTSLASSIESLSCMNQDLHLKLQQQRLATMFGGGDDNKKDGISSSSRNVLVSDQVSSIEKPQTILFQNLDISRAEVLPSGDPPMEWFFGNSYSSLMTPATTTTTIGSGCINGDHDHGNNNNNWINNGVSNAWSDVQQQQPYTALP